MRLADSPNLAAGAAGVTGLTGIGVLNAVPESFDPDPTGTEINTTNPVTWAWLAFLRSLGILRDPPPGSSP